MTYDALALHLVESMTRAGESAKDAGESLSQFGRILRRLGQQAYADRIREWNRRNLRRGRRGE
jgi:hypothetical protein